MGLNGIDREREKLAGLIIDGSRRSEVSQSPGVISFGLDWIGFFIPNLYTVAIQNVML